MSLYDSLTSSIYNSITQIIDSNEVIFSHQSGQEPRGSYCAVNILQIDKVGREYQSTFSGEESVGSDTYTTLSRNEYETTVSFMFVGKEAGNLAHQLDAVMENAASRFYFGTEDLAIMRKGEIQRVPEKRETTWVSNFVLDVVFSYSVETTQQIDIIEDVSWNATIN